MNCASKSIALQVSGIVPVEPVVTKNGIVYEKRLITKLINQGKPCPITNEPLELTDLIEITKNSVQKPRQPSETSIPNTLLTLQSEWDAIMLETFELRKQYNELQTRLSNALYENDAAKRVIARLLAERDEARKALAEFKQEYSARPDPVKESASMDIDVQPLSVDIQNKLDQVYQRLFEERKAKKNVQPINLEACDSFQAKEIQLATAKLPAITRVIIFEDLTLVGGQDGSVTVVGRDMKTVSAKASKTKVDQLAWINQDSFLTVSDSQVKLWAIEKGKPKQKQSFEGIYIATHPCQEYFVVFKTNTWNMMDLKGQVVASYKANDVYQFGDVHPDGLILAAGKPGSIELFDIKTMSSVLTLDFAGVGIKFSENGYHMVAWNDHIVSLYDLRKVQETKTAVHSTNVPGLLKASFDKSGKYLGILTAKSLQIWNVKKWETVWEKSLENATDFDIGSGFEFLSVGYGNRKLAIFSEQ